jgi:hypothetical protein
MVTTPLDSIRNGWWALLFAYGLTGLSLCTLNNDWLTRGARHSMAGMMEIARVAAPTERIREKTIRHLTQQTQRMPLVVGRLLHEDLSSEDITVRRTAAVALLLLAASERLK